VCIANRYTHCMTQIVTRIDDELAKLVDDLVADGVVSSRSDAVRRGLRALVDTHRRHKIGEQIVRGYRGHPQTEHEVAWADSATIAMIRDEPW
jgi:Arc/MetJ-type ribon-helix-helix transcriptional regulator